MPRPPKWRRVEFIPSVRCFVPKGPNVEPVDENILKVEEAEAIRLKDLDGLEQEGCAESMQVSRQTFQRILNTAREKIADSIINGKSIRIEGGNFTRNICPVYCLDCGRDWDESFENLQKMIKGELFCANCQSNRIVCKYPDKTRGFCRRNCHRRGRWG